MHDLFGKRVSASTIVVNDGFLSTTLDLNGTIAAGMYQVTITAGDRIYSERLVVQPYKERTTLSMRKAARGRLSSFQPIA